jgi:hypothetical protein
MWACMSIKPKHIRMTDVPRPCFHHLPAITILDRRGLVSQVLPINSGTPWPGSRGLRPVRA